MDIDILNLGDAVFESLPWEGRVVKRYVCREQTQREFDSVSGVGETIRHLWASGGIFGVGEKLTKSNWQSRYFPSEEDARRHCVEETVKLREERRRQIEEEMARLQEQINEC